MREQNKLTINQIYEEHIKNGWKCKKEQPTIFKKSHSLTDNSINYIDLACQKGKSVRLFEIEDSCFQVLKNVRAMEQGQKELKKQGLFVSKCMLGSGENWKDVCKEMPFAHKTPFTRFP